MRAFIAVASALLLAACYHGPSIYTFDPVHRPTGIDADLRLEKTRVSGELLEVQDSALVVLTDSRRVVSVPLREIRAGKFDRLGTLIIEGLDTKSAVVKLRPFSRFPAGLTSELRARLLAAYVQTEAQVVR